jgi:hypothetical protein
MDLQAKIQIARDYEISRFCFYCLTLEAVRERAQCIRVIAHHGTIEGGSIHDYFFDRRVAICRA